MAKARDVAQYILALVDETEGDFMTPPKLQKLLYYCQGFHLALFGAPLFEERIVRWKHGPVVVEVQDDCRPAGHGPMTCPNDVDLGALTEQEKDLVDEVYEVYGAYSASALRAMTRDEPPCRDTAEDHEIPHEALAAHFRTRLIGV